MKALVVYCHPKRDSFNGAILELVLAQLNETGAEIRVCDLYQSGFDPVLTKHELETYLDGPGDSETIQREAENLTWCDTLIFVYPTWWYGPPALLKGWLDRVLLPDVAFLMPDAHNATIRPALTHITRLGVFTTCGASWWLTRFIGAPGRRILMRGLRLLCARSCKTTFAAHYLMDSSTPETRARHLRRVTKRLDKFLA